MFMWDILQYSFVQNALLASVLVSVLCGIIGTYIVARRFVFIGGGIAHSSLGGVGMGAYYGFSPLLGAMLFALGSAVAIKGLSHRREVREDSAIALLWTIGMSVGILFSYLSPGFMPELQSYLFGSILIVTASDLRLLLFLTLLVVAVFTVFYHPILSVAFDYEYARSQRLPVDTIEYLLVTLVALSIVCSLRLVGIVMVIALLSIPQMTANLFTSKFKHMVFLSMALCFVGCLGGLSLSFFFNVPSGASIIFVSVLVYGLCRAIKPIFCVLKLEKKTSHSC